MLKDLLLLMILALALIGWLGLKTLTPATDIQPISLADVLGEAPDVFRQVTGPDPLNFPADHAAHPDYRSEWWYFTGNLDGPDGRALGFQFTLFRFGQEPGEMTDSEWASDQLWMAHLALSDLSTKRFFQAERFSRSALALAGATEHRWWLRDWQVQALENGWQLQAGTTEFGLDLDFELTRPIVLQGNQGYSQKGPKAGNASRYYSATRLGASGRVRLEDQWLAVEGLAWLDREWGSGQLADDVAGWDWFSLHLNDGRDLMLYRLRHADGSASKWSAGILVEPDGRATVLEAGDFRATAQTYWRDRHGVRWPLNWRVEVPAVGLTLNVQAAFEQQLWEQSVHYWEGSVEVRSAEGGPLLGRGYLELSGYGETATASR